MMIDADVVACSAASVYRVLSSHGLLRRFQKKSSRKGQGFNQPTGPNRHWHIDVSYLNIAGTFYFCATVLDGYSRMVIHWDIREQMKEIDIESILQRAKELHPEAKPRIISDNGPQFIANDFKAFIRFSGMTHVRTSPFYPQSNGKLERYHKTMKSECIRPETPLTLSDAKRSMQRFVARYNGERLHSGIGYVTPRDMFEGRQQAIHEERDRKVEAARQRRGQLRAAQRRVPPGTACYTGIVAAEDKALLGSNLSAAAAPMTGASVAHA
jgi:transposase InsO family protein